MFRLYLLYQPTHFQNYTRIEHLIHNYDLEFTFNGTSNEYDPQPVYNGNGFIGISTALQQVHLAIYDTNAQPFVYTGSENIDITDNQLSLSFPIKINNEIVLNPRAYDNAVFEMISGNCNFVFLQNTTHGGQPISQFYSSTTVCTCHCDCEIPHMYNKATADILIADIYNDIYIITESDTLISTIDLSNCYIKADIYTLMSNIDLNKYYIKTKLGALFSNIDLSNYYTKSEIDDIVHELSTLMLNTYTNTDVDNLSYTNYPSLSFIVDNLYSTTEVDSTLSDYTTSALLLMLIAKLKQI